MHAPTPQALHGRTDDVLRLNTLLHKVKLAAYELHVMQKGIQVRLQERRRPAVTGPEVLRHLSLQLLQRPESRDASSPLVYIIRKVHLT